MIVPSLDDQGDLAGFRPPSPKLCLPSPVQRVLDLPCVLRLEIDSLDTSPFSDSFDGLIENESTNSQTHSTAMVNGDISYDIERFDDVKDLDPEWDDEDVDEIVIISPRPSRRLPTIAEESIEAGHDQKVKTISMSDFELLNSTPCVEQHAKARLCRKRDTGRIYVLRTYTDYARLPMSENAVLHLVDSLRSPFLPRIYWSFSDGNDFSMVMDYFPRKNLLDLVKCSGELQPKDALFYASELLQAICALHATGIVHRDLRPENVMVDTDGHVVLTGFRFSEMLHPIGIRGHANQCLSTTIIEADNVYQAPELILGWAHDFTVDCWGFGMLLHFMLSGAHSFEAQSSNSWSSLKHNIIYGSVTLSPALESLARDLIVKCLECNPVARLSLGSVRKHAYFSAVDWKKVLAKRIPVPHLVDPTLEVSKIFKIDQRPVVSGASQGPAHSRRLPLAGKLDNDFSSNAPSAGPPGRRRLQTLPKIFEMSSLLDDLPDSVESIPSTTYPPDLSVHSALTLNDPLIDTRIVEVNSRDRMALFWETLDLENVAVSPILPFDDTDMSVRPRKLRKSRSSIYPEQRFSALSTHSFHNKLRKKSRPASVASLSEVHQPPPVLNLPTGIHQIGSGIGFTYKLPVAARSKASICTNTPQSCHGIFQGGFTGLGLGLRLLSRAKTRSSIFSPNIQGTKSYDNQEDLDFPRDFGGSSWSLVMPMSPPVLNIEPLIPDSVTLNSPMSEGGPLTPATLVYEEPGTNKGGFEEGVAHEVKLGDVDMTLRLVSRSSIESCMGLGDDPFGHLAVGC